MIVVGGLAPRHSPHAACHQAACRLPAVRRHVVALGMVASVAGLVGVVGGILFALLFITAP